MDKLIVDVKFIDRLDDLGIPYTVEGFKFEKTDKLDLDASKTTNDKITFDTISSKLLELFRKHIENVTFRIHRNGEHCLIEYNDYGKRFIVCSDIKITEDYIEIVDEGMFVRDNAELENDMLDRLSKTGRKLK